MLIGASSWLANIEPIARGSSSFGTRRADVRTIKVDAFDITGHVFEVPAETGQPFRYRFSMRNAGPMPVTTC